MRLKNIYKKKHVVSLIFMFERLKGTVSFIICYSIFVQMYFETLIRMCVQAELDVPGYKLPQVSEYES